MSIKIYANDSIHIPSFHVSTNVGTGGNGYSDGPIINKTISNIDQSNSAGSTNTNTVDDPHHVQQSIEANTHAWQSNTATVDQQANVMAGIGGAGGSGNMVADDGNVQFDLGSTIHV